MLSWALTFLIIAFIAVVVIVAMTFLQGRISVLFSKVGNSLDGAAYDECTVYGGTYHAVYYPDGTSACVQ